jgi:hypothetical protein
VSLSGAGDIKLDDILNVLPSLAFSPEGHTPDFQGRKSGATHTRPVLKNTSFSCILVRRSLMATPGE